MSPRRASTRYRRGRVNLLRLASRHRTKTRRVIPRARRDLSPAQLFVLSFVGLVVAGAVGFRVLPGLYAPGADRLSWIDALFTSTSAVCVTGLIVVDTATHFSRLGQAYVLLLIQLGGLGMLGLASFVILTFRARLSLRQDSIASGGGAGGPSQNVRTRTLVRDVLLFTFLAEFIGFVALWLLWIDDFGTMHAAWHALFHSVSAFCNAGFSTFSDSLVGFQREPLTLLVISGGVIVGGIGFLALEELRLWLRAWRKTDVAQFRLSLHTRLVLATTLVLLLIGFVLFGALEWNNPQTIGPMSTIDKLKNAFFMSVTPRTAGFNTIDYGQTLQATNFTTILFMSIGGAPGGTAGGLKVTTVAVLVMMAWSRLKARATVDVWDRTIPSVTTLRAVGLFAFSFALVTAGIFMAAVVELDQRSEQTVALEADGSATAVDLAPEQPFSPATMPSTQPASTQPSTQPAQEPPARDVRPVPPVRPIEPTAFLDVMFEAVSAFNTVGLSTGITPSLTDSGRVLTILLMFVGRVGPLTIAAALSRNLPTSRSFKRYAHEDVAVG